MTGKGCDRCRHQGGQYIKVGDCEYGNYEWWPECTCEDPRMDDWGGEGECPCYEEVDE